MKNIVMILTLAFTGIVLADEIIVDHASGRSPACGPIQFVTSGTGSNTVLKVNSVSATNVTATAINGATTISGTTITGTTVSGTTSMTAPTGTFPTNVITVMKVGTQTGFTGVITNKMDNYTNLTWIGSGIITNVTLIGTMP